MFFLRVLNYLFRALVADPLQRAGRRTKMAADRAFKRHAWKVALLLLAAYIAQYQPQMAHGLLQLVILIVAVFLFVRFGRRTFKKKTKRMFK